jgi:hypothetical protein
MEMRSRGARREADFRIEIFVEMVQRFGPKII